ncbi:DUF736 domain-containing protein [Caulobacter hibisci]|uniref:DUF736 domain-containing protein n=1 Tax=Caulobacter hibisci TaxID=2035993 RepID=A0ABS0T7G3_9CAUL|nr:DUF736 domain-containing protein [Caulobacter hibisci]MBI1686797.1 DUF736 domain-containing protein [Caulobacter hibisci]
MATIGTFTIRENGAYTGSIDTLTIKLKAVEFRPVTEKTSDKSPDFRVYAGKADLGAAWKKVSKDEKDYLSVKLDDPSFSSAVNAALVDLDGVLTLVWSRSNGPRED